MKRSHSDDSTEIMCDACAAVAFGPPDRLHRHCPKAKREYETVVRAVCLDCLNQEKHDYSVHKGGGYFSGSIVHENVVTAVLGRGTWRKA